MSTTRGLWLVLAGLALFKFALLFAFGPVFTPDSSGYIDTAQVMMASPQWLSTLDLSEHWKPLTVFRAIGYPALIVAAKAVAGPSWAFVLAGVQLAVSLVAAFFVMRVVLAFQAPLWAAMGAGVLHGLGQTLLFDPAILTDSLNASLLVIVWASVAEAVLRARAPTLAGAFGLGMLVLAAFMLREAGAVLQYLLWPLVLFWAWSCGLGKWRLLAVLIAFALPVAMGVQGYKAWNEYRTGKRFITTAQQTAMYMPAFDLARMGVDAFAGDPQLGEAEDLRRRLLRPMTPYRYFSTINGHLMRERGYDAVDVAAHAKRSYARLWLEYPVERLEIVLSKFRSKYLHLFVMPVESLDRMMRWSGEPTAQTANPSTGLGRGDGSGELQPVFAGLQQVARGVSIIIAVAFLIGVPVRVVKKAVASGWRLNAMDRRDAMMGLFWLTYLGYTFAYALVHMEQRYLLPVIPMGVVCALVLASQWRGGGKPAD